MKKTYLFAGTSIFFWSTVATLSKLLLKSYNNIQLLWISSLFAAIFLLVVNLVTKNIKKLKEYKPKDYLITILIGLPGTFLYYLFYYGGADRMLASQAFIINYLWPIMSVLFACIILKEKMTIRKMVAILLSFVGVVIVTGGEITQFNSNTLIGALLCIMGAVSYGIFTALNQKFYYEKRISMMLNCFVTFILTGIINAAKGDLFIPSPVETLGFLWNGMLAIGLATTVWAIALESGKTAKISNLAYITPFVSLLWTSLILKEKLNIWFVVGLVVIVLGIFVQMKDKTDKTKEPVSAAAER